jgi:hypothetical protein
VPTATKNPIPGGLYWLRLKYPHSSERLCELELTSDGVVSDVTLIIDHLRVPVMFLSKQIVHHPHGPFGKAPNASSVVAKCLVGERVAFFAARKEVMYSEVFYRIPIFEEWDMKLGEEK